MKIAILDDESSAIKQVEEFLKRFVEEYHVVLQWHTFENPSKFIDCYSMDYELIFLDIDMPGINGIEVAREIRDRDQDVLIIFITSMGQFAIQGYAVEALDFVVKPVAYEDFVLKMKKALRYLARDTGAGLHLSTTEGIIKLQVRDIFYAEVRNHYLYYHTNKGVYKVRGTIKEAEQALREYHFVRCNQGTIVNLKYVEHLRDKTVVIAGDEIAISRNKKREFVISFTKYMGGLE